MPITDSFRKLVGPLAPYLDRDKLIEEISINDYGGFWLTHGSGQDEYIPESAINERWGRGFIAAIESFASKEISRSNPTLSARLFSGERVEIAVPPCVESPAFSIRIPSNKVFTMDNFRFTDTSTQSQITKMIESQQTILISGGTRSGKTSFLSALIAHIDPTHRIISIEDTRELNIPKEIHPKQVRMYFNRDNPNQSAKTMFMAAMRHNPDLVALAECRGEEALDFISVANSGHYGLTTVHANSPTMAISKMAILAAKGETAMSHDNLLFELSTAIDGVVQITHDRTTQQRVVSPVYTP